MHSIEIPSGLLEDLHAIGIDPTDIVLYVNAGCNLRCKHCYVGNPLLNSAVYYSAESVRHFIGELPRLDRITVLGGEPFLHPQLIEIIDTLGGHTCKERRITTNLTIYRDDIISTLKAAQFRVCVSVDGHTPTLHDALRGRDAFSRTIKNLQMLTGEGVDVEVTHTVTEQNLDSFWDLVALCKSIGVKRLNLHRVSLRGNALENRHLDVSASRWRGLTDAIEKRSNTCSGGLSLRYEVGFVTESEYEHLRATGQYDHHSRASYYSPEGGARVVIFPNQRVYISSEAFGTNSYVGDFSSGRFEFNESPENELLSSEREGFNTNTINKEIVGDKSYPIPLSVSYRRTVTI